MEIITEEIKEIEQYLKKCSNCFTCNNFLREDENGGHCMLQNAYNYITNLQKEKDNYKQRNEKAIEYIKNIDYFDGEISDDIENIPFKYVMDTDIDDLLNILEGGDE